MPETSRRLAAIMFTDIVGYTALMAESEEKGLRARQRHRTLVRPLVELYHGEAEGASASRTKCSTRSRIRRTSRRALSESMS